MLLALAVGICVAIALFTTFDTRVAGDTYCGSPLRPEVPAPAACTETLGHARATRTAALAWGMVLLAALWASDGRRRSAGRYLVPSEPEVSNVPVQAAAGVFHDWAQISFPLGSVQAQSDGSVHVDAPRFVLRGLPGSAPGRRGVTLAASDIVAVERVGLVFQWGFRLRLASDRLTLWGPSVEHTLAACPGMPQIQRRPRRPFALLTA